MAVLKLRFKEFEGDWNLSSLANISSIITGNTPSTSNREYYDGEFLFVSPVDIQENRYIEKTKTTLTANGFSKCRHIPENSVLFVCIGSTIGKVAQNKVICATNQQINAVIPKKGYSSDFLYLQLERLAPNIKLNAGVQAVPLINKTEFGKTLLNTPTFIEQTKIASFLSAVDEKISQLTQKHQLLSRYKQGMMQKLFSQQIRFKADDGSEFGEWKTEKIGNVTETIFGYPFDSKDMVEDNNGIPLMRGINIGERHIRHSAELDRFFMKNISKLQKYLVKENDIVLSMDGSKVGRNAAFVSQKDANSLLVQRVCILRENTFSNIQYIYQWIISIYFHKYVDQVKTSSGIPHISGKQIQEYEIHYPCLEEQTKIANFLSAIDKKINVVSGQLEQAKLWKKGLLQQMFV